MLLIVEILLDAIIIGVILIFLWFVWAYFYRNSDARLTKLAMAKYKSIAGGINATINDNYELTTTSTTVDRNSDIVQVTFLWKPKKAGLSNLAPCTKSYKIKELCEAYDTNCDETITCGGNSVDCVGI
jgi:hypothetical protein